MTVLFGAVQSGFGGAEPHRLPEMLPVRDARGPVEEGAFKTAFRPLVSRWLHFQEGYFFSSSPGQALRFYFMSRLRPAFVVSCAGPALYTFDDVHSSSQRFNDNSAGCAVRFCLSGAAAFG